MISFHTGFLTDHDLRSAVGMVLDAGYDAVELNAETLPWAEPHVTPDTSEEDRRFLASTGRVSSIVAHRAGLAHPDPGVRRTAIDWTVGCLRLAADVGAPYVHVIPGDESAGSNLGVAGGPGDIDAFRASLEEVVGAAEPLGVRLSLEAIVNQLVSTQQQSRELLDEIPGLGVSFDPSHLQVTTGDVTGAVDLLADRIDIVALKDARGVPSDFEFGPLGSGEIDFAAMVAALRRHGYDGYYVVEHEAHVFGDTRGAEQVLAESLEFARTLLRPSA